MTILYSPYDGITFLVVEGDAGHMMDFVTYGGVYDVSMMDPGFDDSSWPIASQPFVARDDPGSRYEGSTWDKFGIEYGPNGFIPPGYTAPDGVRYPGTDVGFDLSGVVPYRGVDIAARFRYTVPANIPPPANTTLSAWLTFMAWGVQSISAYVDGHLVTTFTGTGRTGHNLALLPASVITPGPHLLAFHAVGYVTVLGSTPAALASCMVTVDAPVSPATPPLRQRQRATGIGAASGPPLRQRGTLGDASPPLRQRGTL